MRGRRFPAARCQAPPSGWPASSHTEEPVLGVTRIDQLDCDGMKGSDPSGGEDMPLIDIGRALVLLATAVKQRGEYSIDPPVSHPDQACPYAPRGGAQCLVGHVLSLAQVGDNDLEAVGDRRVRALYVEGSLPVRLTLGALVVLDAAQRTEDRGYSWGDALDDATNVAVRFVDLLPDPAFPTTSPGETPGATSADQQGRTCNPAALPVPASCQ